jgi:hypothetical protein
MNVIINNESLYFRSITNAAERVFRSIINAAERAFGRNLFKNYQLYI